MATAFVIRLAARVAALTVGDGTRHGVQVGPLIGGVRVGELVADAAGKRSTTVSVAVAP